MKKITIYSTLLFLLSAISASAQFTKIHDFASNLDGGNPYSNLFYDGTYLYGVTTYGGVNNNGIMFKVKPDGTDYLKIFDFQAAVTGYHAYGTLISDGVFLYGTTRGDNAVSTQGTVYKIKPDGTDFATLHTFTGLNGSTPWSGLYLMNNFLYGLTGGGGMNAAGTVYRIQTDGSNFETLFNFNETVSGLSPYGELIYDGTFLYGTTAAGGLFYNGTVFKILPDGSGYTKLVDFNSTPSGNYPYGALLFDGTFLYGTTGTGGVNGIGSIFKLKPDGTEYQQLFSFDGANGQQPMDNLVILGNYLYGMTMVGGANAFGTIFRIKPDGTDFEKLFDFDGALNGRYPRKSLISDGTFLYGMATNGGTYNSGVIFRFSPNHTEISETSIPPVVSIYPNPNNGFVTIETSLLSNLKIKVYNMLGELIVEQAALTPKTELDLTNHAAGVFVVKVYAEEDKIVHEKIVVK